MRISVGSSKKVFKIFLETLNSIALDTEELIKTLNGYTEAVGKKVILVPASHKENKETEPGLMHAVFLGITKQGRALVHNEYGKQSFAPGSVSLQF